MALTDQIPGAPLFTDPDLWRKAANNILDRAEGLIRDEMNWRRARPCVMAEYFRLGILEGRFVRWRKSRYSKWHRLCLATHPDAGSLCGLKSAIEEETKEDPK